MAKKADRHNRQDRCNAIANDKNAKNTKEKKRQNHSIRKIVFAAEGIILLILLLALYLFRDFENSGIVRVEFEPEEIKINEPAKENETLKGYQNIALFGVDSRSGSLVKNTRSDSILIASVNRDTGEVKLVSVYRDTYLNLSDGTYDKCNAAYMYGGAKQAVAMLNMNLDLDITDFVTVGFEGLKNVIDALGGVWIDVDKAERTHLNNYQISMAKNLDCEYQPVKETGYQRLDGLQAVAYCRIRYTKGDDFKRTQRQREVLSAMADKVLQADMKTLTDIVNAVGESEMVYTSFDTKEILGLLADVGKYRIAGQTGFPSQEHLMTVKVGASGDCVIPLDLEKNVSLLHEFLFGIKDYRVSDEVKEYSEAIKEKTEK